MSQRSEIRVRHEVSRSDARPGGSLDPLHVLTFSMKGPSGVGVHRPQDLRCLDPPRVVVLITKGVNALVTSAADVQSLFERVHAWVNLQSAVPLARRVWRRWGSAGYTHIGTDAGGAISYTRIVLEALLLVALLAASKPQEKRKTGSNDDGTDNAYHNANNLACTKAAAFDLDSGVLACRCPRARRADGYGPYRSTSCNSLHLGCGLVLIGSRSRGF